MNKSFKPFKKGLRIIERDRFSLLSDIMQQETDLKDLLPPLIRRGKGPYIYDYDDNRFIDFFLADGSILLGHAPPGITKIMKGWLGRGFSSGYQAESHAMLAKKLIQIFVDREYTRWHRYRCFFYSSTHEALFSLFALLRLSGYSEKGVYISDDEQSDWPFYSAFVQKISTHSMDRNRTSLLNYLITRFTKNTKWDEIGRVLKQLCEKGVLIISDETQIESYLHSIHHSNLFEYIHMRVFGNWINSGLAFGCILADQSVFQRLKQGISQHTLEKLLPVLGFPPLYKIKAALACTGILMKYGGVHKLIQKNAEFFSLLGKKYFHLLNNIIYMRENEYLTANYTKLYTAFLQNGIYFPFSAHKPLWISTSHSDELLQKSAGKIDSLFNNFYR